MSIRCFMCRNDINVNKMFRMVGAAAKTRSKISSKKRTTKLGKGKRKTRESSRQQPR
ncbi:MAG: hypothetical protein WBZ36_21720 [Candidatus Nitrosopolaris sp.]